MNLFFKFLLILSFSTLVTKAQDKTGNHWIFGNFAHLNFISGQFEIDSAASFIGREGAATLSDSNGNLLYYTNGETIWNKNHDILKNGDDLLGSNSTTQSTLLLPFPENDSLVVVLSSDLQGNDDGLSYSIINRFGDNGLGEVTQKNTYIYQKGIKEGLIAVRHKNRRDYWIIIQENESDRILVFLLDKNGFKKEPSIYKSQYISGSIISHSQGCFKANCRGDKVALSQRGNQLVEVFDFDNTTGELSNPISLYPGYGSIYGIEFAPNGNLIYISKVVSGMYQFDLMAGPEEIINSCKHHIDSDNGFKGSLQLGPDKKIYLSEYPSSSLSAIRNPNKLGEQSDYLEDDLPINMTHPTPVEYGLPHFINDQYQDPNETFWYKNQPFGKPVSFTSYNQNADSYFWDFGDGNTSTFKNPKHIYSAIGNYEVRLIINWNNKETTMKSPLQVIPEVEIDIPSDTFLCYQNDSLYFDLEDHELTWDDGSENPYRIFKKEGWHWVDINQPCRYPKRDSIFVTFESCCSIEVPTLVNFNAQNPKNRIWKVYPSCDLDVLEVYIFDRWGKQILYSQDPNFKFSEIENINSGSYVYQINYSFIKEEFVRSKNGVFVLTR